MDVNYKSWGGSLIPLQSSIVESKNNYTKFSNGLFIIYINGDTTKGYATLHTDTSKNCFYLQANFNIISADATFIYSRLEVIKITGTTNGSSVAMTEYSTSSPRISEIVYGNAGGSSIRARCMLSGDSVSNYSNLVGYYCAFAIGKWK